MSSRLVSQGAGGRACGDLNPSTHNDLARVPWCRDKGSDKCLDPSTHLLCAAPGLGALFAGALAVQARDELRQVGPPPVGLLSRRLLGL